MLETVINERLLLAVSGHSGAEKSMLLAIAQAQADRVY